MKSWLNNRMKERTSWDGAALVALGLMVLFLAPLAKIAAGLAIVYGAWTRIQGRVGTMIGTAKPLSGLKHKKTPKT